MLSAALSVGLAALLAATIVWTLFDPRWFPFLGGVLFAALLSAISDVSRARWALARRTRQVERLRGRLDEANARSASSTRAFAAAETRLRCLGNVLRSMVLFVDRSHVCRFHNRAAADKLGLPAGVIDGRPRARSSDPSSTRRCSRIWKIRSRVKPRAIGSGGARRPAIRSSTRCASCPPIQATLRASCVC
jgi:hypothetical protein